ncbi:unnamed protein product [Orchesella dallaii]|uniref:Uncharacterized protein n=1 Tax=Orchesella dallaii TaxID=48710 RepID=A0ABP1RI61_9HEXA
MVGYKSIRIISSGLGLCAGFIFANNVDNFEKPKGTRKENFVPDNARAHLNTSYLLPTPNFIKCLQPLNREILLSIFKFILHFSNYECFVACGMIHHNSFMLHNELKSWKLKNKFVRSRLRAFQPICVQVGSFYVIRKGMVLIVMSVISNTAMSLLVSMTFTVDEVA